MSEAMGKLILEVVIYFVRKVTEEAIDWFISLLAKIQAYTNVFFDLAVVDSGIVYAQLLAGTILIVKVAYEAFMTYIMRLDGNPDADPGGLLLRTARAASVIGSVPWIVKWIIEFGTALSNDVALLPGLNVEDGSQEIKSIFDSLAKIAQYELFYCPLIITALVFLIMVVLQTVVRAAELAMIAVSGSFMALGLTNPDSQSFQSWWRGLLSVSLSHGIQLFMLKVSFYVLMFKTDGFVIGNLLMFCAAIWVAYKSPTILKQYMYSSGIGRAATGTTRSVTQMAMSRAFIRGR